MTILVVALGLAVVGIAAGLLLSREVVGPPTAGEDAEPAERPMAPELEGEVLVPPPVRLAQLRGAPILVNFWASWCVPCREEAPELARFDETMRDRARLIGVDVQDTKSEALAFVEEFRWRFPNVSDPRADLATRYGLVGLPTTFVIDREGRIAANLTGPQTFDTLIQTLEEIG